MAERPIKPTHPDYADLEPVVRKILVNSGGLLSFEASVPRILRTAIDEVIDAPRTNRFTLGEIEKTEKTYLGTKIEILLRSHLKFRKGKILDLDVDGTEVDIKNTVSRNWSIPSENFGKLALLIRCSEAAAKCDLGLILMREEYLNSGKNRDLKRSISVDCLNSNVWWVLFDHPYPPNFWEILPPEDRKEIMSPKSGAERLAILFDKIKNQPISRIQVEAVGQQRDYMKRIRRNGGARDILAPRGIALLAGRGDRALIAKLNLGLVRDDEFISCQPTDPGEIELLRKHRHID